MRPGAENIILIQRIFGYPTLIDKVQYHHSFFPILSIRFSSPFTIDLNALKDSLTGILKEDKSIDEIKSERLTENMVLLIDGDILLDVLMNRQGFVYASSIIWKLCETEMVKGYVSALTFAKLVYPSIPGLEPDAWSNDACRGYVIIAMQDCCCGQAFL